MYNWMAEGIEKSDFVFVIATPLYKFKAQGGTPNDFVRFEVKNIVQKL